MAVQAPWDFEPEAAYCILAAGLASTAGRSRHGVAVWTIIMLGAHSWKRSKETAFPNRGKGAVGGKLLMLS